MASLDAFTADKLGVAASVVEQTMGEQGSLVRFALSCELLVSFWISEVVELSSRFDSQLDFANGSTCQFVVHFQMPHQRRQIKCRTRTVRLLTLQHAVMWACIPFAKCLPRDTPSRIHHTRMNDHPGRRQWGGGSVCRGRAARAHTQHLLIEALLKLWNVRCTSCVLHSKTSNIFLHFSTLL